MRKLLIDECLSRRLVGVARTRGLEADHVVWLGKGGMLDRHLIPFAVNLDYPLVTNNRRDFLKAYAGLPLHDGLIVIVPMVARAEQVRLFGLALDAIERAPDTVNWVTATGIQPAGRPNRIPHHSRNPAEPSGSAPSRLAPSRNPAR